MKSISQARVVIGSNGVVNVHVSAETLYNLEATQQLTKAIFGRLGCTTCCSGRQILFQQEENEFTLSDDKNVPPKGKSGGLGNPSGYGPDD
jgi:hypothetical protein